MMKALVTGGAGFIGSHLAAGLIARDCQVRIFDNFSTGKQENLNGLSVEVQEGDLRDSVKVNDAVRGTDLIFHQAAFISVPQSIVEPQECFDVNIQGTLNVLKAAQLYGVSRVVLASSCAVYGNSNHLPLQENESPNPLSPYAASKLFTETLAALYTQLYHLEVVSLRYFNVFGPRQSAHSSYAAVIPIFIDCWLNNKSPTIYGDGHQKRDFVFVSDIVQANILASESPNAPGEVFNVCSGIETDLLELLDLLRIIFTDPTLKGRHRESGCNDLQEPQFAHARSGDIYRSVGDPGRAKSLLGFQAETKLLDGLTKTVFPSL